MHGPVGSPALRQESGDEFRDFLETRNLLRTEPAGSAMAHGQDTHRATRLRADRNADETAHTGRTNDVTRTRKALVCGGVGDLHGRPQFKRRPAHAFLPRHRTRRLEAGGHFVGGIPVVHGKGGEVAAADIEGKHHQLVEIGKAAIADKVQLAQHRDPVLAGAGRAAGHAAALLSAR